MAPIRTTGAPWIESIQRHHAPAPNASSVEKVMKTKWKPLSDILADHGIVPGKVGKEKESEDEKRGENENAIDQLLFTRQVHENGGDEPSLKRRDEHRDSDVHLLASEIDVGQPDRD